MAWPPGSWAPARLGSEPPPPPDMLSQAPAPLSRGEPGFSAGRQRRPLGSGPSAPSTSATPSGLPAELSSRPGGAGVRPGSTRSKLPAVLPTGSVVPFQAPQVQVPGHPHVTLPPR